MTNGLRIRECARINGSIPLRLALAKLAAPPAAQTQPIATEGEQWALEPSEEDEARIMFTAMTNIK